MYDNLPSIPSISSIFGSLGTEHLSLFAIPVKIVGSIPPSATSGPDTTTVSAGTTADDQSTPVETIQPNVEDVSTPPFPFDDATG